MDTKRGSPFPPLRLFSRSDVQILFRVTQSYWLSTPGSLPPCKPHRGARDEADLGLLHRNNWGFLGHSHTAALPHLRWLHTSPQENTMTWPCSCSGSNSHLALSTRTCTRAELVCLYFPFLQSSTMQSLLLLLPTLLPIGCYLFYFTSILSPQPPLSSLSLFRATETLCILRLEYSAAEGVWESKSNLYQDFLTGHLGRVSPPESVLHPFV